MTGRFLRTICIVLAIFVVSPVLGQSALDQLEQSLDAPARPAPIPQPPLPGSNVLPPVPGLPPGSAPEAAEPGYLGMVVEEGAAGPVVLTVREGSPAETVGIKMGDRVVSIDGKAMQKLDDLDQILSAGRAGQTLRIVVQRGSEEITLSPQLVARKSALPVLPNESLPSAEPAAPQAGGRPSLGITVEPISEKAQRQYNLPVSRGAFISGVAPGSPAEQAGIPIGGAIVAVDGRLIDSSEPLVELIRTFKPGQEIELTYYHGRQLSRKTVRLGTAVDSILVPRGTPENVPFAYNESAPPSEAQPAPATDRPFLRKLERVLEGVNNNGGGGIIPPGLIPSGIIPGSGEQPPRTIAPYPPGAIPGNGEQTPRTFAPPATSGISPANSGAPSFTPAVPPPVRAPSVESSQEIGELRSQVRALQDQVDRLEILLKAMEERLPANGGNALRAVPGN